MSESELSAAEDPSREAARLAEQVDDSEIWLVGIVRAESYDHGYVSMLITRSDFTRDLASDAVGVLNQPGGAEDYEVMRAARVLGSATDPYSSDRMVDQLGWCGDGAPDWWSDWSIIGDFLGEDVIAALARGDSDLFLENTFGPAERAAFAGFAASKAAWDQVRADLGTVFAMGEASEWGSDTPVPAETSSAEELGEVAQRWLREDSWREVSATAHRAVASALARHPNTPAGVLEELAMSGEESVRWLVTRNPSATDEIRAAAVLLGVDDAKFTEALPDEDFINVYCDYEGIGVCADVMTREDFAERFPAIVNDAEGRWVTPEGRICIDTRRMNDINELPDELWDYLRGHFEGGNEYPSEGSVTHFFWSS